MLEKAKNFDQKPNLKTGILVSGFVIRGARLSESNNYLDDENVREFENHLPTYNLICKKKYMKDEKKSVYMIEIIIFNHFYIFYCFR